MGEIVGYLIFPYGIILWLLWLNKEYLSVIYKEDKEKALWIIKGSLVMGLVPVINYFVISLLLVFYINDGKNYHKGIFRTIVDKMDEVLVKMFKLDNKQGDK